MGTETKLRKDPTMLFSSMELKLFSDGNAQICLRTTDDLSVEQSASQKRPNLAKVRKLFDSTF